MLIHVPKRRWRLPAVLAAAVAAIAVTAAPALAHQVYDQGWAYYTGNAACTHLKIEISDGANNGGFLYTEVQSHMVGKFADNSANPCGNWFTVPRGYMAVKEDLYVWNGQWQICNTGAYYYTSDGANDWKTTSWNFQRACGGNHWYSPIGYGYVYDGIGWRGGNFGTGNHYIA